jgi:hypothetical protein
MRKLFLWNMVTLDGHFEGQKRWDFEGHNYAWGSNVMIFWDSGRQPLKAKFFLDTLSA